MTTLRLELSTNNMSIIVDTENTGLLTEKAVFQRELFDSPSEKRKRETFYITEHEIPMVIQALTLWKEMHSANNE